MASTFTPNLKMLPLILLLLSPLWPFAGAQAHETIGVDAAGLQVFFDRAVPQQLGSLHIPGAAVAVVKGSELLFAKGYGWTDVEKQIPVQADTTLFRIGSTSKLLAWTAVMQLVEQGRLDLDADVSTYLDFHIPDTYPEPITLRHLMAHTAGFEDRVFGYQAAAPQDMIPLGEWLAAHVPARVRAPGEFSSYSNYGAALVGYIVERVSGIPYDGYIEQNILTPLGMEHTTSRQPLPAGLTANMSKGYSFVGDAFVEQAFEYINPAPTGSATSTATDMARFMIAHLQNGAYGAARLLQETTARQMHTRLFGHYPRLNGFAHGFYEMSQNGQRVIGHGGDTRFFHSLLALIPEKNLGLFVAYNSENAFDAQNVLLRDFMDEFFPEAVPADAAITLPPAELEHFAGSYRQNSRYAYLTVEKALNLFTPIFVQPTEDGALLVASPFGTFRFVAAEPLLFRQEDNPDNFLIFRADKDGNITHAFINDDPTTVFEKQPWYADYNLHYGLFVVSVLLFLSALILALIRWLVQRRRKQVNALPKPALFARRVLVWLAVVGILFPVGFVFAMDGFAYGDVALLNIVLALPFLLMVLTVTAVIFTVRAWCEKYWHVAERIHYALVTLAAVGFVWFLSFWNLIGWRC